MAAAVPNCRAYDPAYAYELAVIVDHGMRRMFEEQADEFFYITLMNENYAQPSLPEGAEEGIIKGLYHRLAVGDNDATLRVKLVGSGAIQCEVEAAATLLADDFGIASNIFSATSFSELAREAAVVERYNRLHPEEALKESHVGSLLSGNVPVVAATDYVRAYPQLIAPHIEARFVTLGTDGFGRSDTRTALRRFFEVDRYAIVIAALDALAKDGMIERSMVATAITKYGVNPESPASWSC